MDVIKISDEIAYADQPTAHELQLLREQGVRTLVNVRLPTELRFEEDRVAEMRGLRYVTIPIAQWEWSTEHFDALERALKGNHAFPAVVHSAEGARAGIVALTWHAARAGWSVDQLQRAGRAQGLDIPGEAMEWLRRRGAREAGVTEGG